MPSNAEHKPYISAKKILPEITTKGIILAIILGFLLTYDEIYKILIELDERLLWHGWPLIGKLHDPIE